MSWVGQPVRMLGLCAALCLRPVAMSAWQANIEGSRPASGGAARAVVVDAAGNVVSAGGVPGSSESIFSVAKLAGSSGVVAWRYTASASSAFHVESQMVGVDRAGNVLAAGFIAS